MSLPRAVSAVADPQRLASLVNEALLSSALSHHATHEAFSWQLSDQGPALEGV